MFEKKKVKSASFSGGGSHCAIEIGALLGHIKREEEAGRDVDYQRFSGVSGGALNAAFLAQARDGSLYEQALECEQMWQGIKGNNSIYKPYMLGLFTGFFKKGIFSTAPLRKMLEENIDPVKIYGVKREIERTVFIGTVALATGEFSELPLSKSHNTKNFFDRIMASSAVPGLFPPVKINGQYHTDGGIRQNIPLPRGVCEGASRVDVFLASPISTETKGVSLRIRNLFDVMRSTIMATYGEIWRDDLLEYLDFLTENIDIQVFAPEYQPEGSPFNFDPYLIQELLDQGRAIKPVPLREAIGD